MTSPIRSFPDPVLEGAPAAPGHGDGMHRRGVGAGARSVRVLVLAALVATACTDGGVAVPPSPDASPTARPSVSASPAASPSPQPEDEVAAAYQRYLDATAAAMEAGDPQHPDLAEVAEEQALVTARGRVSHLEAQGRTAEGGFVPAIQSLQISGDSAELRDCYRVDIVERDRDTEEVADPGGIRFEVTARLTREAGAWKVVDFTEGEFCAPEELADDIEAGYLAFWDAVAAAGRPPDPDHPALAETTAGAQLEGLRERLAEFREQGYEVRDDSVPNPRVDQVFAYDEGALVRDCRVLDPDGGIYDAETGERVRGDADPGQRSLWDIRLELIDGSWRVVDADLREEDSSCEPDSF